jgi:hypothetical protein
MEISNMANLDISTIRDFLLAPERVEYRARVSRRLVGWQRAKIIRESGKK